MELQGSKKRATFADTFSACNSYQEWSIAYPGFGPYIGSGNNCYQTPVLGLGLGVDFTFAWGNNNNNINHNHNNPHLNFVKGTVLGDKEQGVGIRDKG